jgi:acetyltransferase-like isoleucine patch superfamily enzyme
MKMLKANSRLRTITALAISLVPISIVRNWLFRALMGYSIGSNSSIGLLTMIACDSFRCGKNVRIGRNNLIVGPIAVTIGDAVVIGRFNKFVCGHIASDPSMASMDYKRELNIRDSALIYDSHYFDVYGRINLGEGSWVAGVGSQFWTHGASVMDRDIEIGAECYLGSAVRFAPGSRVSDRSIVGLGSVVIAKHLETDVVISGVPAKVIKSVEAGETRKFVFQFH